MGTTDDFTIFEGDPILGTATQKFNCLLTLAKEVDNEIPVISKA